MTAVALAVLSFLLGLEAGRWLPHPLTPVARGHWHRRGFDAGVRYARRAGGR